MSSELPGASPPGPPQGSAYWGLTASPDPAELSNRDLTQMRIGCQRTAFKIYHCRKWKDSSLLLAHFRVNNLSLTSILFVLDS